MHSTRLGYHFLLFYGQCYFSFVLVFFFWCVFFFFLFLFFFCFFFFFSSRRRHTRSKRDWSSDVCSSDLPVKQVDQFACIHRLPPYFLAQLLDLFNRTAPLDEVGVLWIFLSPLSPSEIGRASCRERV